MEINFTAQTYLSKEFEIPEIFPGKVDGEILLPGDEPIGELLYESPGIVIYGNDEIEATYSFTDAGKMSNRLVKIIEEQTGGYLPEQWAKLTGLGLKDIKTGETRDFLQLVKTGEGRPYDVYYPVGSHNKRIRSSLIFPLSKQMLLNKDPFCADGLVSFFHEIGHGIDARINRNLYADEELHECYSRGEEKAIHTIMQFEINSWNAALGEAEPFLSDNPYSAFSMTRFHNAMHYDGLLSYKKYIKHLCQKRLSDIAVNHSL